MSWSVVVWGLASVCNWWQSILFYDPEVRLGHVYCSYLDFRNTGEFGLWRQMISPYAQCNFFCGITLEAFLLDCFEEKLFYCLAEMMPLIYWWFFTGFVLFAALKIFLTSVLCVEMLELNLDNASVCAEWFRYGANIVNMLNASHKTDSSPVFFPEGLPWCLRAVLILHLLLNTLSLKKALRPQFSWWTFISLVFIVSCSLSASGVSAVCLSWPWWQWPLEREGKGA